MRAFMKNARWVPIYYRSLPKTRHETRSLFFFHSSDKSLLSKGFSTSPAYKWKIRFLNHPWLLSKSYSPLVLCPPTNTITFQFYKLIRLSSPIYLFQTWISTLIHPAGLYSGANFSNSNYFPSRWNKQPPT